MSNVHIDNVGDMAVVECEGRFVRSDAAFKLRDAVTSQADARVVVVDLTEVRAIGGGVIGMLVFLQRWAYDRDIRFKLFNPTRFVRDKLEHASSMSAFQIAGLDEMRGDAAAVWRGGVALSHTRGAKGAGLSVGARRPARDPCVDR